MVLKPISWEKLTLSELQCHILKTLINAGFPHTQKALSQKTKATISGVYKALKGLTELGLVALLKQDVLAYTLNNYRKDEISKFITGWKLGKDRELILEGHAFVYEINVNSLPDRFLRYLQDNMGFIPHGPRNWSACAKRLIDGTIKFHKTCKRCKAFIFVKTFGFNQEIIEMINTEKVLLLIKELEDDHPGLKIGDHRLVASCPWQEYALLLDPVSTAAIRLGIKHKKIENSLRLALHEWEEKGADAVIKIRKIILLRELIVDLNDEQIEKIVEFVKSLK